MSEIAVTGANGMMGSHMISLLISKKIPVKPVTRQVWDLKEWKSFNELDQIFKPAKAIFHFGAQLPSSKTYQYQETKNIFDVNIRSCLNLAEWAVSRDIPVIFLSSATVYKNPYAKKIKETDPKVINGFGGFYGYSKVIAEGILSYLSANGLKCIILRPSSLYGYGQSSDKLIQSFINIATSGGQIEITGSTNKINFIHASDVAWAALQAYNTQSWNVFNISSKENNSILEVAENAVSISRSGSITILNDYNKDRGFTRFDLDSNLANESFCFEPKVSLKEGMKLMMKKTLIPC